MSLIKNKNILAGEVVQDSITNGVTTKAPSQNAVFDALALKIDSSEKGANSGVATLDSGGKVPVGQLPNSVIEYQGTWNASTNSPTLADGTGNAGDVYVVSTSGSQNLGSGSISFVAGDWVMYNGTIWQKSVGTNAVVTVNGQAGVVVLDSDDISEGSTNLYFTNARAIAAPITGYTSGAGTVAATDSILQAIQKLNGNIAAIPGAATWHKESITLVSGDITAQEVTLAHTPVANSLDLVFNGVVQVEGVDYSISGADVAFLGDLATGGGSELVATDVLRFKYQY